MDQDAILAYLSDGTRLRTDNVRELVGAQDQVRVAVPSLVVLTNGGQTIYVFNKHYLDLSLPEVLKELRVEPPLQLPIEGTLSFLLSHRLAYLFFHPGPPSRATHRNPFRDAAVQTVPSRRAVPTQRTRSPRLHHPHARHAPSAA